MEFFTGYERVRGVFQAMNPKKPLVCHFCGNVWDSKNRVWLCPRCHVVYNPQKCAAIGFAGEVIVARRRTNTTQAELAKIVGCAPFTLRLIEKGFEAKTRKVKSRIIKEKLRIWVESTKSPIDRRNEIDRMFQQGEIKGGENFE